MCPQKNSVSERKIPFYSYSYSKFKLCQQVFKFIGFDEFLPKVESNVKDNLGLMHVKITYQILDTGVCSIRKWKESSKDQKGTWKTKTVHFQKSRKKKPSMSEEGCGLFKPSLKAVLFPILAVNSNEKT